MSGVDSATSSRRSGEEMLGSEGVKELPLVVEEGMKSDGGRDDSVEANLRLLVGGSSSATWSSEVEMKGRECVSESETAPGSPDADVGA